MQELQNIKQELDKNDKIQKYQSDDLISFISSIQNLLNLQFQTPLNDIYNRIQTLIQEQSYLLYTNFLDLVQDQLKSSTLKDQQKLSSLQLIIQAGFDQKISEFISQQLKQIKYVRNSLTSSINDIQKKLKPLTDAISSKIKTMIINEDISINNSIENSLQILNSIYDKQYEFQFEIEIIYSEIQILFDTFYYLNRLITTTIMEDAKQQIENFQQACSQSIDKAMLTDFDIFKEKLSDQEKLINTMVVEVEKRTNEFINQAGTFQQQINYPAKHISYNNEKNLFANISEATQKIFNLSKRTAEKQKYEKLIEQLKLLSSPDEINTLNLNYRDNIIIPFYGMQENPENFWQMQQKNEDSSDTSDKNRNNLIEQFHSNYLKAKNNIIAKANSLNVWYSQYKIYSQMIDFIDTYNDVLDKDIRTYQGYKGQFFKYKIDTQHQVNFLTPITSLGLELKLNWEINISFITQYQNGQFELTTSVMPNVTNSAHFNNGLFILYSSGYLTKSSVSIRYRYFQNKDQSLKGQIVLKRDYEQQYQSYELLIKQVTKTKSPMVCGLREKLGNTNDYINENLKYLKLNYDLLVHGTNPVECYHIITTTTTYVKVIDKKIEFQKYDAILFEKEF